MTEVDKLLAYFGKRIVYVNGTATITREMV